MGTAKGWTLKNGQSALFEARDGFCGTVGDMNNVNIRITQEVPTGETVTYHHRGYRYTPNHAHRMYLVGGVIPAMNPGVLPFSEEAFAITDAMMAREEYYDNSDFYANAHLVYPFENYERCDWSGRFVPPQCRQFDAVTGEMLWEPVKVFDFPAETRVGALDPSAERFVTIPLSAGDAAQLKMQKMSNGDPVYDPNMSGKCPDHMMRVKVHAPLPSSYNFLKSGSGLCYHACGATQGCVGVEMQIFKSIPNI